MANLSLVGVASGYLVWNYQNALIDEILFDNLFKISSKSQSLEHFVDAKFEQISLLATLPVIKDTMYFHNLDDDFLYHEHLLKLVEEGVAVLHSDPNIMELILVSANNKEVFKMINDNGEIRTVVISQLNENFDSSYLEDSTRTHDDLFVSDIKLNIKNNKVVDPRTAVLNIASPVISDDGDNLGIFLLKYNMDDVLSDLIPTENGKIVMFNQDGEFIHHADQSKEFSTQLGTEHNYFTEQPELRDNTKTFDSKFHHDKEESEYRIWDKIFYSENTSKFWVITAVITEDEIYEPVKKITIELSYIWFGIIGLTIGVTLLVSVAITRPEKNKNLVS